MTDKLRWKDWQATTLRIMIDEMMLAFGSVDMGMVSNHCNHSIASCSAKAASMGIKYTVKKKRPYLAPLRQIRGDMRMLPKHRNGKKVNYDSITV